MRSDGEIEAHVRFEHGRGFVPEIAVSMTPTTSRTRTPAADPAGVGPTPRGQPQLVISERSAGEVHDDDQ